MNDKTETATARQLLVLDLDETLVHATEADLGRPADFTIAHYNVYRRPHLAEFIRDVSQHFELGVWTSSGEIYAEQVVQQIFPPGLLKFVWSSKRCTTARDMLTGEYTSIKNLSKLRKYGFSLESIIAVDDTPSKYARHFGNLVRVREFVGDLADDELLLLGAYLPTLKAAANVRSLEKRHWRATPQPPIQKQTSAID